MKTSDLKSFQYLENGEIVTSELSTVKSQAFLDPGSYTLNLKSMYPEDKILFFKLEGEEEIEYQTSEEHNELEICFSKFFDQRVKDKMKAIGICHKVGILMHGKEGTGKTSTIKYFSKKFVKEQDAIVITMLRTDEKFPDTYNLIKKIRAIQDNPIVLIFEELDMFLGKNLGNIKIITDGILSIENCIIFATTNEISKIPDALKARKSRFKYVFEVNGIQNVNIIFNLCSELVKDILSKEQIEQLSNSLIGSTLDEIKQKCIDIIMDIKSYKPKERRRVGFSTS